MYRAKGKVSMRKALMHVVALLVVAVSPLGASTFSIIALEDPAAPGGAGAERLVSSTFGLLFDQGSIVTGGTPQSLPEAAWESWLPDFRLQKEGMVDYAVVICLAWTEGLKSPAGLVAPRRAAWLLWRVADGKRLSGGELLDPGKPAAPSKDPDIIAGQLRAMGALAARSALAAASATHGGNK
jgi:hypothetical protein